MMDFNAKEKNPCSPAPHFADFDVLYTYSRAQALADGVLVDVTPTARELGFVYPVALTAGLWADIQTLPEERAERDATGRLWDVLWMARVALKENPAGAELLYKVIMPVGHVTEYTVRIICGPGDHREPVLTLLRENED